MNLRKLRIFSQVFFFLLFLFQVFLGILIANRVISSNSFSSIFFYFDPLMLFHSIFTVFVSLFLISLFFLFLSIFFRRYFCGWICPLGSLIRLFSPEKLVRLELKYRKSKIFIFFAFLFFISTGFSILFLDPITIAYRFFSSFFYPSILNFFFYLLKVFKFNPPSNFFKVFPSKEIFIFHSFSIGIFFIFIIVLNFIEKNFWCKFVCPLGGLFQLFSMSSYGILLNKNDESCTNCGMCQAHCTMDINPIKGSDWYSSDCILCMNCVTFCPENALTFRIFVHSFMKKPGTTYIDSNRRKVLKQLVKGGIIFLAVGKIFKFTNFSKNGVLRPPGALKEEKFLETCIRCGECVNVCPTNYIHPSLFETSLEGIYTPICLPQYGYCESKCVNCSQVCPSGAIKKITVEEKLKFPVKIGTAVIDRNWCIPWSDGKTCIVCEEVCPALIGEKAIKLREKKINKKVLKVPYVDTNVCNGCGICENRCPKNPPAITVKIDGATRF